MIPTDPTNSGRVAVEKLKDLRRLCGDEMPDPTSTAPLHLLIVAEEAEALWRYVEKFGFIMGPDVVFNSGLSDRGDRLWDAAQAAGYVLPRLANIARECAATAQGSGP